MSPQDASEFVYLDHAASSPQRPEVTEAMAQVAGLPGNPSALHGIGRAARRRVEESREEVAELVGCHPSEVLFTSGGTEADNLAVLGGHEAAGPATAPVVTTHTEHAAVTEAVGRLAAGGAPVRWAEVDAGGVLTASALAEAIEGLGDGGARATLASVVWGNNETGVLQDLPALAEVAGERGCVLHSDAVQVLGHAPLDLSDPRLAGVGLVSLAAHKVGGPQGVGVLVARRGTGLSPTTFGGGQERRVRSGTVPVALAVGMAAAVRAAAGDAARDPARGAESELVAHRAQEAEGAEGARVRALRTAFEERVVALGIGVRVTASGSPRLDHISHVTFEGCRSEDLLFLLDSHGIAVSAGSACSAGVNRPSHVLEAMGEPAPVAASGLRFSWGWSSVAADGERALAVLPEVAERARAAAAV
ncbi:cysteine desulfurase [Kytococcus sedentarius]|uniref:cysteine desulfurase n=1 Tax=Kytococcus sedentarius (strain ATCC 14392 / DSM 20547 / JCM 11482 / CCUG 33030 / NBRC 15357 / NCTC 11040 / CCM 314 / 541) TaxID=478801 RepID=C7NG20_KYTSD|nr:cysteine desulfurase family protein [Kytococcus sedentarius]ACV06020.1 cysteine desulfurase family protein [Kytococcus sedentarius DSM 20547]QQB64394.1 cysteine desulfurase [Kytococcus sedentarius]STX12561.1 Cysteine desulfurase [Kytococcus sedentarius]